MNKFSFCLMATSLFATLSCGVSNVDEWEVEKEPIGIMYFDGVELREYGYTEWVFNNPKKYYGGLYVQQETAAVWVEQETGGVWVEPETEDIFFIYFPKGFTNNDKTIKANYSPSLCIKSSSKEHFDGGYLYYLDGDEERRRYYINVSRNNNEEYYLISSATVLVSCLQPYLSYSEGSSGWRPYSCTKSYCRIDYSIMAIDSLGITHKVVGWATPDSGGRRTTY